MDRFSKQEIKDIAKTILYAHAQHIDHEAFYESEDIISHEDFQEVINEVKKISEKMLNTVYKKYGPFKTASTRDVILAIAYEISEVQDELSKSDKGVKNDQ